jgi:hypothetical protein
VVKVVERGRFRVYVYEEIDERHHLPHCHVFWADGRSVVRLDRLELLAGRPLPRAARELLQEYQDDLLDAWARINAR